MFVNDREGYKLMNGIRGRLTRSNVGPDVKPIDTVLDPTCGTAGFLIAAMHRMLSFASSEQERRNIISTFNL